MFAPYTSGEKAMMRCARGRGRREAGLSLVELMIAIVVIAIALIALVSLIVSSSQVQQETREKTLAYNAARLKIEEMRNSTFDEIFRKYNAAADTLTTGDTGAPGPSNPGEPGNTFDVSGLKASSPDTYPGRIFFPQNYSGTTPSNPLVEDMTTPPSDETDLESRFALPMDLNRDGDSSDADLSAAGAHKILPVVLRVRWVGVGKKVTSIYVSTLITNK
jgi:Tfp pilus assembly protein PilV